MQFHVSGGGAGEISYERVTSSINVRPDPRSLEKSDSQTLAHWSGAVEDRLRRSRIVER
jgi:hypothetical protein